MPNTARGTWYSDEFTHLRTLTADNGVSYAYVRLPRALQQPTDGCSCTYCRAHPDEPPMWDALAIPLYASPDDHAFTVHAPEWRPEKQPAPEPAWLRRRQR